jgi:threonine/homoserine/homoserine lactone efflux protein
MSFAIPLLLAFSFSFVGSIPPGILNLTVVQLGLEHRLKYAYRFAVAAALIEYPYAWAAVKFEKALTSSVFSDRLQLVGSVILLMVGAYNAFVSQGKGAAPDASRRGRGFRRGLLLGIMNPMALPFWLAVTAYLNGFTWFSLTTQIEIHSYLAGVALGAFALLISVAHLAKYASRFFTQSTFVKVLPGCLMLALGLYGIINYLL